MGWRTLDSVGIDGGLEVIAISTATSKPVQVLIEGFINISVAVIVHVVADLDVSGKSERVCIITIPADKTGGVTAEVGDAIGKTVQIGIGTGKSLTLRIQGVYEPVAIIVDSINTSRTSHRSLGSSRMNCWIRIVAIGGRGLATGEAVPILIKPFIDDGVAIVILVVTNFRVAWEIDCIVVVAISLASGDSIGVQVKAIVHETVAIVVLIVANLRGAGIDGRIEVIAVHADVKSISVLIQSTLSADPEIIGSINPEIGGMK